MSRVRIGIAVATSGLALVISIDMSEPLAIAVSAAMLAACALICRMPRGRK